MPIDAICVVAGGVVVALGAAIFIRGSWLAFAAYCEMLVSASIGLTTSAFILAPLAANLVHDLRNDFASTLAALCAFGGLVIVAGYFFVTSLLTLVLENPLGSDPPTD